MKTPPKGLIGQRIGPHLEFYKLARGPFTAFHMEWRSRRDRGIDALSLPAAIGIIDTAVEAFGVVTHWIRHAQRHEFAVHQHQQSLGQIAGRKWHVLADT